MWAPDPNVGPRHGKSRNISTIYPVFMGYYPQESLYFRPISTMGPTRTLGVHPSLSFAQIPSLPLIGLQVGPLPKTHPEKLCFFSEHTPLKLTAKAPKNCVSKSGISFSRGLFSVAMLVSGRVFFEREFKNIVEGVLFCADRCTFFQRLNTFEHNTMDIGKLGTFSRSHRITWKIDASCEMLVG